MYTLNLKQIDVNFGCKFCLLQVKVAELVIAIRAREKDRQMIICTIIKTAFKISKPSGTMHLKISQKISFKLHHKIQPSKISDFLLAYEYSPKFTFVKATPINKATSLKNKVCLNFFKFSEIINKKA